MYISLHFPIAVAELLDNIESGKQCIFDIDNGKIYFRGVKRVLEDSIDDLPVKRKCEQNACNLGGIDSDQCEDS